MGLDNEDEEHGAASPPALSRQKPKAFFCIFNLAPQKPFFFLIGEGEEKRETLRFNQSNVFFLPPLVASTRVKQTNQVFLIKRRSLKRTAEVEHVPPLEPGLRSGGSC